ncbi:MAG: TrmH family RNA methyltransferase, partial [Flavobacteriales bacterium]|nr:TrmH family RNA methyltransferase [Flavobacteriales bacterium]
SEINWNLTLEQQLDLHLQWAKNALKDPEGLEKRFWEENLTG